jgi:hypothetical protein
VVAGEVAALISRLDRWQRDPSAVRQA